MGEGAVGHPGFMLAPPTGSLPLPIPQSTTRSRVSSVVMKIAFFSDSGQNVARRFVPVKRKRPNFPV